MPGAGRPAVAQFRRNEVVGVTLPTVDGTRPVQATHEAAFRIIEIVEAVLFSSRKRATRGRKLATVAQPCGYPVDGQMDCLHHALVGIASPVTLQQVDLHMVERIEVGKAVLD
jgi:hypothetical protein